MSDLMSSAGICFDASAVSVLARLYKLLGRLPAKELDLLRANHWRLTVDPTVRGHVVSTPTQRTIRFSAECAKLSQEGLFALLAREIARIHLHASSQYSQDDGLADSMASRWGADLAILEKETNAP